MLLRALSFLEPHRRPILGSLLLTLLVAGLQAMEPLLVGRFFDSVLPPISFGRVVRIAALLAALELGREVATSIGSWLNWRTRIRLQQQLLEATVGQLQRVPLSFHRQQGLGETMTAIDRGIQGFVGALSELAFQVAPAIVYLIVSVGIMARLEPRLAALVLVLAPLPPLVGALAAPEQTRRERALMARWRAIYGRFHEVLGGILTVRSFGMEDAEQARFVREVSAANEAVVRGLTTDTVVGSVHSGLATAARVAALLCGGWLVSRGQMTGGAVLSFVAYVGGLFGPVQRLTGVYQTLARARASLEVIFGILDVEHDPPDAPEFTPLPDVTGDVRFERVSFRYEAHGPLALDGLDLHVKAGERVALVGPSGSGKTTLVALLERLHDPTSGTVRIDGIDLRSLDQRALRRRIGVVLQDGVLFNDTVRANIAYGRPDADPDQIRAAARAACAHDFVEALPQGYDTVLGERGSLLSVGQRQRIAIARALLKDPPILLLDEATSALDAESEARVQDALDALLRGRTSLIVAHRLATVVSADRIVVLDRGRIVDQGAHHELVRRLGLYAELVSRQVRGLIPDGLPRLSG